MTFYTFMYMMITIWDLDDDKINVTLSCKLLFVIPSHPPPPFSPPPPLLTPPPLLIPPSHPPPPLFSPPPPPPPPFDSSLYMPENKKLSHIFYHVVIILKKTVPSTTPRSCIGYNLPNCIYKLENNEIWNIITKEIYWEREGGWQFFIKFLSRLLLILSCAEHNDNICHMWISFLPGETLSSSLLCILINNY